MTICSVFYALRHVDGHKASDTANANGRIYANFSYECAKSNMRPLDPWHSTSAQKFFVSYAM